jgi:hypothetical protein
VETVRPCPLCGVPVLRLQRSGPRGSVAGLGPVVAYPCLCWMPVEVGRGVVGAVSVGSR